MSRKPRTVLTVSLVVCSFVFAAVLGTLYILQSRWFQEQVRQKIVTSLEGATLGTVEIGSFSYNWRNLTAEFRNLVIHGTESPGSPPLFRARAIRVRLKIVSLIDRSVNIALLVIDHPRIYLSVRPDGTTNVPGPTRKAGGRAEAVQKLLDLKVQHFEFRDGAIEADNRWFPLDFRSENMNCLLIYHLGDPRYEITLLSPRVQLVSTAFHPVSANLRIHAQLRADSLGIQELTLSSNSSHLRASGKLEHFAHPSTDLAIEAQLGVPEVSRVANLPKFRDGELNITGTAHFDEARFVSFKGKMQVANLIYQSKLVALTRIGAAGDVVANEDGLRLEHLSATALGGHFAGGLLLEHFKQLQLNGRLDNVPVEEASLVLFRKRLPWTAVASGPVHLAGPLGRHPADFAIKTDIQVQPRGQTSSVSGNLSLSYQSQGHCIEFGSSHLVFGTTQMDFSGRLNSRLQLALNSASVDDLKIVLSLAGSSARLPELPALLENGSIAAKGILTGPLRDPAFEGDFSLTRFRFYGQNWDKVTSKVALSRNSLQFSSLSADRDQLHIAGSGDLTLSNWTLLPASPAHLNASFRNLDLASLARRYSAFRLPLIPGIVSGSIEMSGSLREPNGSAQLHIEGPHSPNHAEVRLTLRKDEIELSHGRAQAGMALIAFSGIYRRAADSWRHGEAQLAVNSNGFPLDNLAFVRESHPEIRAQVEIHAKVSAELNGNQINPTNADGMVMFRRIIMDNLAVGDVTLKAETRGQLLNATFSGNVREGRLAGAAQAQLVPGFPMKGNIQLSRIGLSTLYTLLNPGWPKPALLDGFLEGGIQFDGSLREPGRVHSTVQISQMQLTSSVPAKGADRAKPADLIFQNRGSIILEASQGTATVRQFQLFGSDTNLSVAGSISYLRPASLDVTLNGSVDMRVLELFDTNLIASGQSLLSASLKGAVRRPAVSGTLQLKRGSFFLNNVPNGLSALNGTITFNQDHATIQKLTAQTGGGELSLAGSVSFGQAGPLVYHLEGTAENVRMRYASTISVTVNSALRLSGTSESSLLSGSVTVSRIVFNPNTDVGNLLAFISTPNAPPPTNEKDFVSGLHLDIGIEGAPNLQVSTALSRDVEAEIDLRVRGTPNHPILFGTLSANQGDIRVFGTKYSINRGEIGFFDPVKIEPVLDLDLQTQARGIAVDITIAGTLGKLNVTYRSDPPLQPRDIIALLTVGRAPETASTIQNTRATNNDVTALQSGANTVLGQAISPVSNRLSKLFGITNIKIDPLVQGITNTPQARLTLEQQISRDITVTYVTNLSQTSEQIFRLEWALSRQYSIVALRDDNGEFGIDFQYKKRFK